MVNKSATSVSYCHAYFNPLHLLTQISTTKILKVFFSEKADTRQKPEKSNAF